ncbi:MAG: radical SAM protein [Candidatus Bathyarchaeia archaeon]
MTPRNAGGQLPQQVRISLGSAMVLGLLDGKLDAAPTTAYLMTFRTGKCVANCGFCPQARESSSTADMLSRVSWPVYPTELVLDGLEKSFRSSQIKRACIQALNYPRVFTDLPALTHAIHKHTEMPVSVSCQPLDDENMRKLAEAGAERIGIPLDAATREIFGKIKGLSVGGPYRWERQLQLLKEAVGVFGEGRVSTHLIVGLGETQREMVNIIQQCFDMGVLPALFAFTPISGTALEHAAQPPTRQYRRIQVARHLIVHEVARSEDVRFDQKGCLTDFGVERETLSRIVCSGKPFQTSGCPNCNRPYYNEKPSGPIYNYPRELNEKELLDVQKQLGLEEL